MDPKPIPKVLKAGSTGDRRLYADRDELRIHRDAARMETRSFLMLPGLPVSFGISLLTEARKAEARLKDSCFTEGLQ